MSSEATKVDTSARPTTTENTVVSSADRVGGRPGKEVSVQAWVEDPYGQVLFVRQVMGKRFWSLPGGKVEAKEGLEAGLRREVFEEIGMQVTSLQFLTMFDRPEKASLALLYRVTLQPGKMRFPKEEIETAAFFAGLPPDSTPTARHFWQKMHASKKPSQPVAEG